MMLDVPSRERNFRVCWCYKMILMAVTFFLSLYIDNIFFWGIFSINVYLTICMTYKLSGGELISGYMLIVLFLIMFHSGQIIVYIIMPQRYLPIFIEFSMNTVVRGYRYILLCIEMFDIAYSIIWYILNKINLHNRDESLYNYAANILSKLLLVAITPIILIETLKKMMFSLKKGYMNLYAYDGKGYVESPVMPYLRNLFVIMCIMNIISNNYNKKKMVIPISLLLFYSAIMFLSGSRSGALSVILTLLILYFTHIKKKKKGIGKYVVLAVVLMFGSVFMSKYRLTNDMPTYERIQDAAIYAIASNPITETFIEMGGSIKPLLYCIDIFNTKEKLKYGTSYLASVFLLIPNLFHILGPIHPASQYTGLAEWLMNYMCLDHGPGFSIIAESYYNFGQYGVFVFAAWGIIFSFLIGKPGRQICERDFISYATLFLSFFLIRGSLSDFIRYFVYEIVFINIFIKLMVCIIKRKGS